MMENQLDGPNGGGSFNKHDFMPVDSWRILRIMSEFVESFEDMSQLPERLVAVFGSARTAEDNPDFK